MANNTYEAPQPQPTPAQVRDKIRAAIFATKPKAKLLDVFGIQIELRQPGLKAVLEHQSSEDKVAAVAQMLIKYAYVPGTSTPVFEDVDVDGILALPFGEDFQKIQEAINELTGISATVEKEKGNLPQTQ